MMMDCKQCAEDLTAFLDEELSAADSERVRSHLAICVTCADEWRSLKEASDFIESHKNELEPGPESWNMVRARISTVDSHPSFRFFAPRRWRVALAALAIAAACTVGYLQYQSIQRRSLSQYMSQYIQDRERRRQTPSILADAENLQIEVPYADNPFIEVTDTLGDNPFRSEDR
jgi:anti-sigma factor RsiW